MLVTSVTMPLTHPDLVPSFPSAGESPPAIAWPTLLLFVVTLLVWCTSMATALAGIQPLWMAVATNAVVSYVMFTVMHDASHHAVSRKSWINATVGQIAAALVAFQMSFAFFRFVHIEHHRNTNEGPDRDPDALCSLGPRWQLPLRWLSMDIQYAVFWMRRMHQRPIGEVAATIGMPMLGVAGLFWAGLTGHLLTVIVLVIVPQRLAGMALAWAFDYLPHHELTATARQDEFQATRNRIGMEWLMTPLLLSQNYHQIHHLHPSIPFYRYLAVWRRNEREYVRRGASLTTIMGKVISPQHYLARVGVPDTVNEHRRFYPLTVTRVQRPTTDSVAVTLSVPEDLRPVFAYRPGQHVTVQADIAGTTVRRSYSICGPVVAGQLRIAIRQVEGGIFSSHAVSGIRVGDRLDVMPPTGRFVAQPGSARKRRYGAIAAGSGITPILSILEAMLDAERDSRFVLLYANRNVASIMFLDELLALQLQYGDRLEILHFLSRPAGNEDTLAHRGRLTAQAIESFVQDRRDSAADEWFLCGPPDLMATATSILSSSGGAQAERIQQETFSGAHANQSALHPEIAMRRDPCAITLRSGGKLTQFVMPPGRETVLDVALNLRPDLPYSCLGGACGTCRARVTEGSVAMAQNHALSEEELRRGYVLCCQSRPTSATLSIDFDA